MLPYRAAYEYVVSGGARLFTAVLLPEDRGQFPVIVLRSPYVNQLSSLSEEEICGQLSDLGA